MTVLCVILANCLPELLAGYSGVVVPCVILVVLCAVCVIIIWRQPESKEALTFKVTPFFWSTGRCCFWDWLDTLGTCCYDVIWESVLSLASVSLRFLFFPGCPCSVFSSTSTSWCSWTWVHGAASPSGWLWVRSSTTHPVLPSVAPH